VRPSARGPPPQRAPPPPRSCPRRAAGERTLQPTAAAAKASPPRKVLGRANRSGLGGCGREGAGRDVEVARLDLPWPLGRAGALARPPLARHPRPCAVCRDFLRAIDKHLRRAPLRPWLSAACTARDASGRGRGSPRQHLLAHACPLSLGAREPPCLLCFTPLLLLAGHVTLIVLSVAGRVLTW
jgi:hypothetical protein